MSASVTCFLPCPLSSNKGQMIRGGTALPPSTAFFRTTKVNKSPMKVVATVMVGEPITMVGEPIPTVNGSGLPAQADPVVDKAAETKSPNMTIVADKDNELVVEFHMQGQAVSKDEIKNVVSYDHNYLIIEGKEGRDGAEENPSGSLMWSQEAAFDNHFRLPKDWDKNQGIKGAFDEAREVLTVTVPKTKMPNAGLIWE